ncbi:MAG: sel1 repeat family protein [Sulfuritalea sp.]|nr:sel1 repeat family protein [Sulfuritalea sp.]
MRREFAWIAMPLVMALCASRCWALSSEDLALVASAAERGSAASQVLLAVACLNGDGGLARDPARAAYWFEQAAIQGNAYAETRLGDLYEQGLGIPPNAKLAFDWRIKAALRGEVPAQVKVGRMYQEGIGVDKNSDLAAHWFRRAAAEGSTEAHYLLDRINRYGSDAEVENAAARTWFEKAARQGYESAALLLNMIRSIGYQIDESWHNRAPDLKKLAEDGDLEAEYQLARHYESGTGGARKDVAAALGWYRRAAAGGHPMAMTTLEQVYAASLDGLRRDPAASARSTARTNTAPSTHSN